jgi:hypothetical protein
MRLRLFLAVLSLVLSPVSPRHHNDQEIASIVKHDLCFINAFSSHHYSLALGYIYSVQHHYPCMVMYIYDLGLTTQQRAFLNSLPYLTVLKFTNNGQPYYQNGTILFKPAMILNFMDLYSTIHRCRYFFYGHSTAVVHKLFDHQIFSELFRHGLVVEQESKYQLQSHVTSPRMYSYFNRSYDEDVKSTMPLRQVHSGLMLVDATNTTLRNHFFPRWADCVANPNCLNIPKSQMSSTHTLSADHLHRPSDSSHRPSSHHGTSAKHTVNRSDSHLSVSVSLCLSLPHLVLCLCLV